MDLVALLAVATSLVVVASAPAAVSTKTVTTSADGTTTTVLPVTGRSRISKFQKAGSSARMAVYRPHETREVAPAPGWHAGARLEVRRR